MNPSAADLKSKGFVEMPDGSFEKPTRKQFVQVTPEKRNQNAEPNGTGRPRVCVAGPEQALAGVDAANREVREASTPIHIHAGSRSFVIKTTPIPAPRMTRRDKWLSPRRPCVQRYFDYRDTLQLGVGDVPVVPDHITAVFYLPMPESWTKKKRQAMNGKPHKQKPDLDNLDKAVKDALFLEDGGVWSGEQRKFWCFAGQERVELTFRYEPKDN